MQNKALTDTERLNWLLLNSGLSPADCEGATVYLVVTEAAVPKCAGTHLPEYQQEARNAIDALMSPIVPVSPSTRKGGSLTKA